MKKPTLATVKAFIRQNRAALQISVRRSFDGMVDGCVENPDKSFSAALTPDEGRNHSNALGIAGAWFVLGGRDYFSAYDDGTFAGFKVYNACGSFILAVRKQPKPRARWVDGQWQLVSGQPRPV